MQAEIKENPDKIKQQEPIKQETQQQKTPLTIQPVHTPATSANNFFSSIFLSCCQPYPKNDMFDDSQKDAKTVISSGFQLCARHKKQVKFVCLPCSDEPLLCQRCIIAHKDHDWVTTNNFLTEEMKQIVESGKSNSGKQIEVLVQDTISILVQYEQQLHKKIKETLGGIILNLEKLKSKFPVDTAYQLTGHKINHINVYEIKQIIEDEKKKINVDLLRKSFQEIIELSKLNINQNLETMKEVLGNSNWGDYNQGQVQNASNNFLSIYKKTAPSRKFAFSQSQKGSGIKVGNKNLTAIYTRQIPKSPVILFSNGFRDDLLEIGFKITKLDKHFLFFNMTRIYVGVCNQQLAQSFGYLDIAKPSKGAYMMSSSGKVYHTKLPEYYDASLGFSFGSGDLISVSIDKKKKQITFRKRNGRVSFGKTFTMPLALQEKFISQLRGCVMFENQVGAQVTILNEIQMQFEIDGKEVYPVID